MPTTVHITDQGNQTISGIKSFANNLQVSGTGIFNALDLNNIDNLSLSGVDVTIKSGLVSLTNRPTVNGTGVLLSGQNVFVLQGGTNEGNTTAADTNYIGLAGANIGYSNTVASRRVPILENCVARKVSIILQQGVGGTPTSNITGSIVNLTQGLTGIISQSMSSTNNGNFISFSNSNLNVPFSAGDNAAVFIHNPLAITNLRTLVNVYFYN